LLARALFSDPVGLRGLGCLPPESIEAHQNHWVHRGEIKRGYPVVRQRRPRAVSAWAECISADKTMGSADAPINPISNTPRVEAGKRSSYSSIPFALRLFGGAKARGDGAVDRPARESWVPPRANPIH